MYIKDYPAAIQAKVWSVLSSNATTHKAQLFALTQCVEVLSKNGADPSFASGGGGGAGGSSASGGAASLGPSSAWDLCPYLLSIIAAAIWKHLAINR